MAIDRRMFLHRTVLGAAAVAALGLAPSTAAALGKDEATAYVRETIEEVATLLESSGDSAEKAARLRDIMQSRAAMPQIARFVAGPAWRGMSESQQSRFVEAFTRFVSAVYADKFDEYSGEAKKDELFRIDEVIDAGKKGMLVRTSILRTGEAPVTVEWLVSDRPGRIVIADIVIEGVSLLVTQRQEIGSMLESRGGNMDKLIADLASA